MPTYEFLCEQCGDFTALRPIRERDAACACPQCGARADRVILSMPALATMSGQARAAYAGNERARHAPRSSAEWQAARKHAPGCGCCAGARASRTTQTVADGSKAFPSKRPWMISH